MSVIIVADYKKKFGTKDVTVNRAQMNILACGIPCTPAKCLSYWYWKFYFIYILNLKSTQEVNTVKPIQYNQYNTVKPMQQFKSLHSGGSAGTLRSAPPRSPRSSPCPTGYSHAILR